MSYASVTAHNAPPAAFQPTPDPALLTTPDEAQSFTTERDSRLKISPEDRPVPSVGNDRRSHIDTSEKREELEKKARRRVQHAEEEGIYLWEVAKSHILRPGVAGGLVGVVNVGLLAGAIRSFYTQPELRRNTKVIASTAAGALGLIVAEGYAAEQYRRTPAGQAEERRAREEGSLLYKHSKQVILRPGVLGGIVGIVNTAVLGTLGYYSYVNWDRPTAWDKRTLTVVSVGLLTLFGGEGILAERYN